LDFYNLTFLKFWSHLVKSSKSFCYMLMHVCRYETFGQEREGHVVRKRATVGCVLFGPRTIIVTKQHQQVQSYGSRGTKTAIATGMFERESPRRRVTKVRRQFMNSIINAQINFASRYKIYNYIDFSISSLLPFPSFFRENNFLDRKSGKGREKEKERERFIHPSLIAHTLRAPRALSAVHKQTVRIIWRKIKYRSRENRHDYRLRRRPIYTSIPLFRN